jgi:hypothetical protein
VKATATDLPKENNKKAVAMEAMVINVLTFFRVNAALTMIQYFMINPALRHLLPLILMLDAPELPQP